MLKEIKIIDDDGKEIKSDKNDLVIIPLETGNVFVSYEKAKEIHKIIEGQLLLIEENNVGSESSVKYKNNPERKTGSAT